jgi:hypothetical protein
MALVFHFVVTDETAGDLLADRVTANCRTGDVAAQRS